MMIYSPILPGKVDRLSAFFNTFDLEVSLDLTTATGTTAHLSILGDESGMANRIILHTGGSIQSDAAVLVIAAVDFGGRSNPLMTGLSELVTVDLTEAPALRDTAAAFMTEVAESRCGRSAALSRLCEVMLLLVLRSAIDQGDARPGLLAGLAHPLLHRALVAIHDEPARAWNVEDLAREAGMSRSHFMHLFPKVVGMTPAAYLSGWRLTVARRQLAGGIRIKSVARQVGFGSAAAFSRAYFRKFGSWPSGSQMALPQP